MHRADGPRDELDRALELAARIAALLDLPEQQSASDNEMVYECRVAHALTLGLVDQLEDAARLRDDAIEPRCERRRPYVRSVRS